MSKNKLIPELRFPEFVNEGEWKGKFLGQVYDFKVTNSLSREFLTYNGGKVKNIHYGDIHTKFNTLFDIEREIVPFIKEEVLIDKIREDCYCIEGDIVFADASEDLNDVGKSIEIVNLSNEKLVSGLHTLLARQRENKLAIGFGGYLFKSDWIRKQIQREAQGAKVLGISANRISNIKISYPNNKDEQQKIASSLSSLDEVIAAHSQKLELLKDHKKGLMQNLFPQEGEKVPKLRFKEFKNDGEWVEKSLGEVGEIITGNTPSTTEPLNYNGGKLFVSPADINGNRYITQTKTTLSDIGFSKTRQIQANSILFVCIGSTIGKVAQNKVDCATNQQINSIIPFTDYSSDFIFSALEYSAKQISELAGIQAVPIINKTQFSSVKLLFPKPKEQQKIASCLSSLDALIVAQAEKIEQLKLHKKGLMQGLFPKMTTPNSV